MVSTILTAVLIALAPVNAGAQPLSRSQIEAVVEPLEALYRDAIEQSTQKNFVIALNWNDIWRLSNLVHVDRLHVYINLSAGAFLESQYLTQDGLALILCHEIAHLLGGEPRESVKYDEARLNLSVEGQSDYWAGQTCFREYVRTAQPQAQPAENFDHALIERCQRAPTELDRAYCQRVGMAAMSLFAFFLDEPTGASFSAFDNSVVTALNYFHPNDQCRVDTYIAGALNLPRPTCWYFDSTKTKRPWWHRMFARER